MAVLTKKSPYTNVTHQKTYCKATPGTFHLYKTGHGNMHILDTDDQTRLYDMKTHSFSSPDILLYRLAAATAAAPASAAAGLNANANTNVNNPILCGSAKFHDLSCTIDLQTGPDQPVIPFKAPGMLSSSRTFESCVGELKWKHDMRLLNTREEVVATFTHHKEEKFSFHTHLTKDKSPKKWGWFEIAADGGGGGGQRLIDEIILSGVALLLYERRAMKYGAMGEAAGGVGGGIAAAAGGWFVCMYMDSYRFVRVCYK